MFDRKQFSEITIVLEHKRVSVVSPSEVTPLMSCIDNVQVLSAATGRVSASRHWNDDLQQSRIPSIPHTSQLSARGQPGGRRWAHIDQPSSGYDW